MGLHVTPPTELAPVYKPSQIAGAKALVEQDAQADLQSAATLFERKVAGSNTDTQWRTSSGHMVAAITKEARTQDLVILGQYEWEGPAVHHPLSLAEAIVGPCGRPVLVVPGHKPFSLPKRALVAWDGSREAVRAIHDAMPLLLDCHTALTLAWFEERHEAVDLHELQAHLERHGIVVSDLLALRAREPEVSAHLLTKLEHDHFDLLVMGAFGHPAWFEFLFGGATASALLKAKAPIFISH